MPPENSTNRLAAFFAEFKRGAFYKAIALYAAVGWLAIQLATSTFPVLGLPIWAIRLVIGLVVAGFPVVFLLAWAFITRLSSRRLFWIVLSGVIVAAGGLFLFGFMRGGFAGSTKIVAVLPFADLGGREESALFADGLHDDLLSSLATLKNLSVVSRASVSRFRERQGPGLTDIGKQLGASHIVAGTIGWSGDYANISLRLFDVASGQEVWTHPYSPRSAEFLALRETLTSEIAVNLRAPLTRGERAGLRAGSTDNLDAWISFRRGRAAQARSEISEKNYLEAINFYKQACEHDPGFALALARLSIVQALLRQFFDPKNAFLLAEARKNADKALTQDTNCAEAHIASARCAQQEGQDNVVRRELSKAVDLLPNDAGIRLAAALTQEQLGWEKQAAENYERAYKLSPSEPNILFKYGHMLYESNQASKASDLLMDALRLQPNSVLFRILLAAAEVSWRGDTAQANNILAGLPQSEDAEGRATSAYCTLALLRRDFEGALKKLREYKAPTLATVDSWGLGGQDYTVEAEGTIRLYKGESVRARECFQQVLWKYETAVWEDPESPVDLVQRALIYAWMGWKEAALADAKAARDKEKNVPAAGPMRRGFILGLAKVYVWTGDRDRAVEQIALFVKLPPSGYSYHNFRLDPAWDSLRDNRGFQQQLEIMKRRLE